MMTQRKATYEERIADKCMMCKIRNTIAHGLCNKCIEKASHDAVLLSSKPSTISNDRLVAWLKKSQGTTDLLFIHGHYNEHPEQLQCPYDVLLRMDFEALKKSSSDSRGRKHKTMQGIVKTMQGTGAITPT